MTFIIIGAGSRGTIYGTWAHKHGHTVIAIAELRPDRLEALGDALEVPEDMRFRSAEPPGDKPHRRRYYRHCHFGPFVLDRIKSRANVTSSPTSQDS